MIGCLENKYFHNFYVWFFSQGALYGIVVCGITSFRIWFGPLPLAICDFQLWVSVFVKWCFQLSLFFLYLAKFMYICVWKHMRDMNDDLIVTFIVRIIVFISIWVTTTGIFPKNGISSTQAICTGVFNDHDDIMDSKLTPEKSPQPYKPLQISMAVAILFFMASVTYRHKKTPFGNETNTIIQRPKDLDSTLLNFAVLILILINGIGYNLYFRGQVHNNNESK